MPADAEPQAQAQAEAPATDSVPHARRPVEVFAWPPRPFEPGPEDGGPTEPGPSPGPATEVRSPPSRLASLWGEIESGWLGVAGLSWSAAARRAGWAPDAPGDYCPRCASSVGPFEADADGCAACRGKRLAWARAVRLGPYEGVLREAILSGKYTGWKRVCQELGRDLGGAIRAELATAGIEPGGVVVCPIPTGTRRRLGRGIDHTLLMGREAAAVIGCRCVRILSRSHRPPQQGLGGAARRQNVAGAFRVRGAGLRGLEGHVVILVDDVRTTGATLSAAARALREGARHRERGLGALWTGVCGVTARG